MAIKTLGLRRGKTKQDVVNLVDFSAGDFPEGIAVTIDRTAMTQREAVVLLEEITKAVLEGPWPPA